MISPRLAACLTGAALMLLSSGLGMAETTGVMRPMARPASLVVAVAATPLADGQPDAQPDTPTDAPTDAPTEISATAAPEAELPVTDADPGLPEGPVLGATSNLPIPRYVSLKTDEGNVRRGPSLSHRIDWVFTREDMPLRITEEYGHWRRVVDRDGLGGWVHYSLVSGNRTVIVDQDMLPLLTRPEQGATENARLEQGVIARLGECNPDWCRIFAGGYRGWVPKDMIWGVDADEVRD